MGRSPDALDSTTDNMPSRSTPPLPTSFAQDFVWPFPRAIIGSQAAHARYRPPNALNVKNLWRVTDPAPLRIPYINATLYGTSSSTTAGRLDIVALPQRRTRYQSSFFGQRYLMTLSSSFHRASTASILRESICSTSVWTDTGLNRTQRFGPVRLNRHLSDGEGGLLFPKNQG